MKRVIHIKGFPFTFVIIVDIMYLKWGCMMLEKIKDKLNEVVAIAETCPAKYQVKCFEILLSSLVRAEAEVPIKSAWVLYQ